MARGDKQEIGQTIEIAQHFAAQLEVLERDAVPGPELRVVAPWDGYDRMTAADIRDRIRIDEVMQHACANDQIELARAGESEAAAASSDFPERPAATNTRIAVRQTADEISNLSLCFDSVFIPFSDSRTRADDRITEGLRCRSAESS